MIRPFHITTRERDQMLALARAGFTASEIAAETGRSETAVRRVARGVVRPDPRYARDLARYRRLVAACEACPRGGRADVAARFGFANPNSMRVRLHHARKALAAEARA